MYHKIELLWQITFSFCRHLTFIEHCFYTAIIFSGCFVTKLYKFIIRIYKRRNNFFFESRCWFSVNLGIMPLYIYILLYFIVISFAKEKKVYKNIKKLLKKSNYKLFSYLKKKNLYYSHYYCY